MEGIILILYFYSYFWTENILMPWKLNTDLCKVVLILTAILKTVKIVLTAIEIAEK